MDYKNLRQKRILFMLAAAAAVTGSALNRVRAELAPPRRAEVFDRIDRAFRQGRIDAGRRIFYRVAALRAPERLPAEWRQLVEEGQASPGCYTRVMVEAFQALPTLKDSERGEVGNLLLPPADLTYTVDATQPFPVRITFEDPNQQSMAETILSYMEDSYALQVLQWGFWEPLIEPGTGFFRVYIFSTGMGGGAFTVPYQENTDTPHADAYAYIVVDPDNTAWALPEVEAHEFNHACQAAMDVFELGAFWENTATYIMSQSSPTGWPYIMGLFPSFQHHPYRPLEYLNVYSPDGYEYGAALWIVFLEHLYGQNDPSWIRRVWEGSVQQGAQNEPDYFDVLASMLEQHGGFDESVLTFAQYRFFAGDDDDGEHLPGASDWPQSEVARQATWTTGDLPILEASPQQQKPQPNGCNYIVVELDGATPPAVKFTFSGQPDTRWNVDVMSVASGRSTTFQRMAIDPHGQGTLTAESTGVDRLVMVVCHLAAADYDPDESRWPEGQYSYSIETGERPEPADGGVACDGGGNTNPVDEPQGHRGCGCRAQPGQPFIFPFLLLIFLTTGLALRLRKNGQP